MHKKPTRTSNRARAARAVSPPDKPFGQRLIDALTDVRDTLRSGIPLKQRYTTRTGRRRI